MELYLHITCVYRYIYPVHACAYQKPVHVYIDTGIVYMLCTCMHGSARITPNCTVQDKHKHRGDKLH